MFFEKVTGFRQLIDFMTPPMSLSVAAAFDDQAPGKEKNNPNHHNTNFAGAAVGEISLNT